MLLGLSPSDVWLFIPATGNLPDRPTRLLMRCSIGDLRVSGGHTVWFFTLQTMADGDPLGAREWLCALGQDERRSVLPRFPMGVADDVHLVRIALAVDDGELAEHTAEAARSRSQLNPSLRTLEAVAAHATGLVGQSEIDLAKAVALYETGPRPLALASALEDLGVITVERGSTEDGVDHAQPCARALRRSGRHLGCGWSSGATAVVGRASAFGLGATSGTGLVCDDRIRGGGRQACG